MITLYELCGKHADLRFSPYVWRTKMCLKHKGLDFDTVPCSFTQKQAYAPSGSKTVPVIKDHDQWISDSWDIALYLEKTYPDAPSLFNGEGGKEGAHFISNWAVMALAVPIFKIIVHDIFQLLGPEDQTYFRESREARIGMTLEESIEQRPKNLKTLAANLRVLEMTLAGKDFIGGKAPNYMDYAVFGIFQWARQCSNIELLPEGSAVATWREIMLDLYDGYAGKAPTLNDLG